jgi:DNA-binding winged helix-turn-helix (wHTH) protein/tetratricopeptide (TPR) repeat protein
MRYVFGNYTLDTLCYELRRAEALIPLRPKVFHLLAYLLTHRDRVISRQELCARLWPDQFVSDATLNACLAQARRAVGDSGRTQYVIQTRHGHGYRFVAAVAVHEPPAGEDDRISSPPLTPRASTGTDPAHVRVGARHPHPLLGERKVVTTLVCTLPNVAMWAQLLEAEALHQRMQGFFALVLEEVERYGGTLQRVLDDGVLVLFGAPLARESCYTAHLTDQVERLAHHAYRGEVWDKAVTYLHQAGIKAVQCSAYREAMAFCEEALRALQHLPDSRDTFAQAIDLRLDLRAAFITTREFERLLAHLRAAETMAQTLGDERRLGRIYCYMANYFQQTGAHQRGIEFGQRALSLAMTRGDVETRVQTHYFLGQAYYALDDYRQAMTVVRQNIIFLKGNLLHEPFGLTSLASVSFRVVLVKCLAEVGAFAEGSRHGEDAVCIAEISDHSHSCFLAYLRVGDLYLRQGHLPQTIRLLEGGLRRWQAYKLQSWFPTIASALGYAYILAGQVAGAMPLLERALVRVTSMQSMFELTLAVSRLSEALLLVGRMPEALALAGRALEHAQVHKERGHEA